MRLLDVVTRDPLLKLTALVLAFLLWALVETGNRGESGPPAQPVAPEPGDSGQSQVDTALDSRSVPVAVRLTGNPMAGWELAGAPSVDPPQLTVRGPLRAVARIDSLRLPAIRLDGRMATTTLVLPVDTAGLGVEVAPARVRVTIPLRPLPAGTGGDTAVRPDPEPVAGAGP